MTPTRRSPGSDLRGRGRNAEHAQADGASSTARSELERRLSSLPGLVRAPSRHGDGHSYFVAAREVAHFHGDARLDVRLTKERIRELKGAGSLDPRVETRGPTAEWATLRLHGLDDVPIAVELIEEAVRANA